MSWRRSALVLLLAGWSAWAAVRAEEPADEVRQRQRIAQERSEVEARYAAREAVCQERFIVTACIEDAKAVRRDRLDALRRQEEVLDSHERRRRAAARLEAIREKTEALERPRVPAADVTPGAASAGAAGAAPSLAPDRGPRAVPRPREAATTSNEARDALAAQRAAEAAAARQQARRAAGERRAAAASAAADRAAAAEQRREEAAKTDRSRSSQPSGRKPSAPLPPRPALPPASGS